jgi:hypothetical protein
MRSFCSRPFETSSLLRLAAGSLAALPLMASSANAQCTGFNLTQSNGATLVPGTVDIGNHCDDCVTAVTLPFSVSIYGVNYTALRASSNGNLQFTANSNAYTNECLPEANLGIALLPYWDDLLTNSTNSGIYTSTSGTAPNRIFNIEWRATQYSGGLPINFAVRLYEDNSRVEYVYNTVGLGGSSATIGAEHTAFPATQFSCNTTSITPGTMLTLNCTNGPISPSASGSASPSIVTVCGSGANTLLSVLVNPGYNPASTGLAVTTNLSSIGGSVTQAFYDDGTHGDATAGDNRFSFQTSIPSSTSTGSKLLPFIVSDAQGRSASGNVGLQVNSCPTAGPDVWVARLTDVAYYGTVGGINAYAIGTDACNQGDVPVQWIASNNTHPVIGQNIYRLKNGRFEQIGQSWLKHGFSSTNSGTCGTCTSPPLGGQQLGVGCSDAYGAGLNGSQGGVGPRSEVNSTTGAYPYPFTEGPQVTSTDVRLQVFTSDVDPAQNAGALYFGEAHYVTADDARWTAGTTPATNGLNNASFQRMTFANTTSAPALVGGSIRTKVPAIQAWKDADPAVTLVPADYIDTSLGAPGIVARFWVGAKATDNGNGTWHYEYAVYNMNADRAGADFVVPVGNGAVISNIGFHGIFAHSGEPYPNTSTNPSNWVGTVSAGQIRFAPTQSFIPPAGDNVNALRWGTLYNFRFDSTTPPTTANATLALLKPGTGGSSVTATGIPAPAAVPGRTCDSLDFNNDGNIEPSDVDAYFSILGEGPCLPIGTTCNDLDFNNDGNIDPTDVDAYFSILGEGACL